MLLLRVPHSNSIFAYERARRLVDDLREKRVLAASARARASALATPKFKSLASLHNAVRRSAQRKLQIFPFVLAEIFAEAKLESHRET